MRKGDPPPRREASRTASRSASGPSPSRATRRDSRSRRRRTAVPRSSAKAGARRPASVAVQETRRRRSRKASPPSPRCSNPETNRTASSASWRKVSTTSLNGWDCRCARRARGPRVRSWVILPQLMALSDVRLSAQAAFVARRLLSEGLVKAASAAELRHALEAALAEDRDRERALDEEVKRLLEK